MVSEPSPVPGPGSVGSSPVQRFAQWEGRGDRRRPHFHLGSEGAGAETCISPETPGDANAGSSQILLTAAKAWRLTKGCTCLGDLSRQNPKLNSAAAGS